jgi:tRNA 2-selenouridine synthase
VSAQIEVVPFPFPPGLRFDEVIDVRSPSEFDADHLTGAVNLPVLSDEERADVGALYLRNRFEARKLGAAMAFANIAKHLRTHFAQKTRDYQPVIYCWRGGQRSHSLATVLAEIGWKVALIDGGYKAYRRRVLNFLETEVESRHLVIINGLTGSGKTQVLETLEHFGAQVLNLERFAIHKGSVFGADLSQPQPTQKRFDSLLYDRLSRLQKDRPIFVEAESPKIGSLDIPALLWKRMRQSEVIEITASLSNRVALLMSDYQSWFAFPERVLATIDLLQPFHSRRQIEQWKCWCSAGMWPELIESLLVSHYDNRYGVAGGSYYCAPSYRFTLQDHGCSSLQACATAILHELASHR